MLTIRAVPLTVTGLAALLSPIVPQTITRNGVSEARTAMGQKVRKGRLEFDAFQNSKQYQNNRDSTRTADVDSRELGFRFLYRVMPKTQLVFDVRDTNFDYRGC